GSSETPQSAALGGGIGAGIVGPPARFERPARMNRSAPVIPRRRRWPLFVPSAVVVLLAVAWSGLWLYASACAKTEIAAWRAREAQAGRAQDCAAQSIGGYPFRIESRCDGAIFTLAGTPTL